MKFKAIELYHIVDLGHEYIFKLLILGDWSVLQASLSWSDYSCGPFLQVKTGGGTLLSVVVFAGKLGLDIDLFGRLWKRLN